MLRRNIVTHILLFLISVFPIYSIPAVAQISFTKHTLNNNFRGAFTVQAIDMDGDGDTDILGAAMRAGEVAWWRNEGDQNFTKYTIDSRFKEVWWVNTADLDRDGDIDVLGASVGNDEIAWWENDGDEHFTKHIIDSNFDAAESVYADDMDGDGDIDVVGLACDAAELAWYENNGSQHFTKHTIGTNLALAHAMHAADVDSDGDVDVLTCTSIGRNLIWWENDGEANFIDHTLDRRFGGAYSAYTIDVDGDGDIDILGAAHSANQIAWWENDAHKNFTKHIIDNNFVETHSVYAADMDGDGDIDVIGAAREPNKVAWWENDGNEYFSKHIIDDNFIGARMVVAAEIDGDGDIDIVGASVWGNEIAWWENNMPHPPTYYTVSGNVSYYSNGLPVKDVTLTITGEVSSNETTNVNGDYDFEAERGTSFTVTPSKPVDEDIGEFTITTYDAALTARHAINLDTLNTLQQMAADADEDGHIYTFDAALICRYAVGLSKLSGSRVGEWLFMPEDRVYESLDSNRTNQDYTGIIIGNVHDSWMPSEGLYKLSQAFRYYEELSDMRCENGELSIPLSVEPNQEILSADIELTYDPGALEFTRIVKTQLSQNFQILHNSENGRLRIGMYTVEAVNDGGILVEIVFKIIEKFRQSTSLQLKRFQLNDNIVRFATTQVSLTEHKGIPSNFSLGQNYPNPFNRGTIISYQIPQSGWVSLKIYNLLGQEVRTLVAEEKEGGFFHVSWDGKNQAGEPVAGGIYIYQLRSADSISRKKLLKLE